MTAAGYSALGFRIVTAAGYSALGVHFRNTNRDILGKIQLQT